MDLKNDLKKALEALRKEEKRKFDQTLDLIVNLQKFDIKKNSINLFVKIPYQFKEKKICAFLESRNKDIDTITKEELRKYSDKKEIKKVSKKYDFFIAQSNIMPAIATTFGRVLGPMGKMPSPQLGILMNVNEKEINELREKINKNIRIRAKEASLKIAVGKESMKDEEIIENISTIFNTLTKELQKGQENIKNLEIKFTMSKPIKIKIR